MAPGSGQAVAPGAKKTAYQLPLMPNKQVEAYRVLLSDATGAAAKAVPAKP